MTSEIAAQKAKFRFMDTGNENAAIYINLQIIQI
jgi:hypothetical protein